MAEGHCRKIAAISFPPRNLVAQIMLLYPNKVHVVLLRRPRPASSVDFLVDNQLPPLPNAQALVASPYGIG